MTDGNSCLVCRPISPHARHGADRYAKTRMCSSISADPARARFLLRRRQRPPGFAPDNPQGASPLILRNVLYLALGLVDGVWLARFARLGATLC